MSRYYCVYELVQVYLSLWKLRANRDCNMFGIISQSFINDIKPITYFFIQDIYYQII